MWVDDIAIAYSDDGLYEWFKKAMSKQIKCKFEDELRMFVGLEITRE